MMTCQWLLGISLLTIPWLVFGPRFIKREIRSLLFVLLFGIGCLIVGLFGRLTWQCVAGGAFLGALLLLGKWQLDVDVDIRRREREMYEPLLRRRSTENWYWNPIYIIRYYFAMVNDPISHGWLQDRRNSSGLGWF